MKKKLFCEISLHIIILIISYLLMLNKHLYVYVQLVSPILNPIIYIYLLLILISYILIDTQYKVNTNKLLVIYILFLLVTLFLRPINDDYNYNKIFYLDSWIKRLFHNKIIFLNIIGNIILYIPLGYLLKKKGFKNKKIIGLSSLMIIGFEFIQFILKVGVFDFIDICLNIGGVITGMLVKGTDNNE